MQTEKTAFNRLDLIGEVSHAPVVIHSAPGTAIVVAFKIRIEENWIHQGEIGSNIETFNCISHDRESVNLEVGKRIFVSGPLRRGKLNVKRCIVLS